MTKMTNIQKREWASLLYTKDDLTIKEISDKVGVTQSTIKRWSTEDDWDTRKAALTITRENQIQNIYNQVSEINRVISEREIGQRYASVKEATTLSKLANTIDKLERDVGLSDTINVGMKFTSWLREGDIKMAQEVARLFDSYIKSL